MLRRLPRTVIALGVVSLLADVASEMVYPLLPLYLTTVLGATALSLGIVEGVADSTASLLKLVSGVWSDRVRARRPLVIAGYSLSGLTRPFIALAATWPTVLALRFVDRVGKGVRTSPRDALIADVVEPAQRGEAYGLHRSMDHAGAVLGPLVAAALMQLAGLDLRQVFVLTLIPAAAVVVVLVTAVREPERRAVPPPSTPLLSGWSRLKGPFRRLLVAVAVFSLGNSTDAFLLLRLSGAGLPATWVAVLWSAHHVVKMAATYGGGRWSDRIGRRLTLGSGWALYALVYLGFAITDSLGGLIALFLVYGLYFGLTEPVEKALVADLAPSGDRGTAFGVFHTVVGAMALPASVLFGWLWSVAGTTAAFSAGAGLAAVATVLLAGIGRPSVSKRC